jgi:hypothetical protein
MRRTHGSNELVHANDATAFACGRAVITIIENYQNEDMTVRVPKQLQLHMGGKQLLSMKLARGAHPSSRTQLSVRKAARQERLLRVRMDFPLESPKWCCGSLVSN